MKKILGISAFYHDSAAAIIVDGKIIAAAQEERFSRKKHDSGYPFNAVEFVLKFSKFNISELDAIVFYEKPFLKFERLLETYVAMAPKGFAQFSRAMPSWLREKLFQKNMLINLLKKHDQSFSNSKKIFFSDHHLSHAASAYFPSPFDSAIILTADGVGEWATTTVAIGKKNSLKIKKEIHFPHSLGLLYSAFTYYTGFKVNSGEYKLMGLAPYGEPKYVQEIKNNLIDIKDDGTFKLDISYFKYHRGFRMTSRKFHKLFGAPPRESEKELTQFHMDLAASIQVVTEEVVIKLARSLQKETGIKNLCLAGGVALNCVANGKLLEEKIFDDIWIQPASGDAGSALGAALLGWHEYLNQPREVNPNDSMKGTYLGCEFSNEEIIDYLNEINAPFQTLEDEILFKKVAHILDEGKVIGWFNGPMEFGPRSLGGRSIIGDPRDQEMQSKMNLKIKYRESFRPFAPSVLEQDVSNQFELNTKSPYMLLVAPVKKELRKKMTEEQQKLFGIEKLNIPRSSMPAITHVDYSARVQTVSERTNPRYYQLINIFKQKTDCPAVVNTSFNVRGEPIVCTPQDAYRCFMRTEMDVLVLQNQILFKHEQAKTQKDETWKQEFELD